ncbi:MAG: hypothetical protein P1Q69_12555, partial [Candidatus Thorarchaeota archaeon]|nr:hypothetical protein [Candidatus Thorarchaeota archaeon]
MQKGYFVILGLFLFFILPLGTGSHLATPPSGQHEPLSEQTENGFLSDLPVIYTGNGAALDVSLQGEFTTNSSFWTSSSTTYAEDLTSGTTYSITNASTVTWTAYVLVSPPTEVENVNFTVSYPATDWKPVSVTSPIGTTITTPSDYWYENGTLTVSSGAIDSYGMWSLVFEGTNHLTDLQLGLNGGTLDSTATFDITDSMKVQVSSSWITSASVEFELTDPSGTQWHTATNTTSGSTTYLEQSFLYRKDITIDHTQLLADVVDFPMMVNLFDTDLKTDVQSDGDDIIFVQNGVVVPHQIEQFDQVNDPTRARLITWIKVNLSSSVDTDISMYYGNPIVGPQENPTAVWSSEYEAVWHLSEPAANEQTTAIHYDSTSGGYDGNQDGNQRRAAQIAYGQDFDGTNDLINVTEEQGLNPVGDVAISGWFRLDSDFTSSSTSMIIMEKYLSGDDDMHIALAGTLYSGTGVPAGSLVWKVENDADFRMYKWTQQTSWSSNTWYHFVCTMDNSDATNNRIYINGIDNTDTTYSGSAYAANLTFSGDWGIGGGFADSQFQTGTPPQAYFDGTLDEIRVINAIPTSNWILTEYTNQAFPGSFYSSGSETSRTSPDLSIVKTIDSTADAGIWKATARYNDSGSSVNYRVGFYQRDFIVTRDVQFELVSPGD